MDSQTTEEFNKFENGSVDATDRTDVLVKQMQDKNRQLIVTTMQKMANAVKRPQYAKIMDVYKDEKVVFIIDECHRLPLVRRLAEAHGARLYYIVLTASAESIERRLCRRGDAELVERALFLKDKLEHAPENQGRLLDNTGLSAAEQIEALQSARFLL